MPELNDLDLKSLQARVLEEIESLQLLVKLKADLNVSTGGAAAAVAGRGAAPLMELLLRQFGPKILRGMKESKQIDEATRRVRIFLTEPATRRLLCPVLREIENNLSRLALRSVESDAREIACAITPALAARSRIAGDAVLPLDPLHFALSAWMIARTGVAKYCANLFEAAP